MVTGLHTLALLSLFDGLGTARHAVGELLRVEHGKWQLVGSWLAEWHHPLPHAVEVLWRSSSALTGCVPHEPVANDMGGYAQKRLWQPQGLTGSRT